MKKILTIVFVFIAGLIHGQIVDTLYYNTSWELTTYGQHNYYRIATIDTVNLKFQGEFKDFFADGNIYLTGNYDKNGTKNGEFIQYYDNSKIYTKGSYKNNEQIERWEYYTYAGETESIVMFNDRDFIIEEHYNSERENKVTKGTGTWTMEFPAGNGASDFIIANFKDSKRSGVWEYKNGKYPRLKEEYKENGELKKGKEFGFNSTTKYKETKFTKSLFYPLYLDLIEAFQTSATKEIFREDYPYLKHLPNRPLFVNEEGVLTTVDVSAEYEGGMAALYEMIARTVRYPREALQWRTQGTVYVQFVITENGEVANVSAIKGIGHGCNQEAIRVMRKSEKWSIPMHNGKPVKQKMVIPVKFQIQMK